MYGYIRRKIEFSELDYLDFKAAVAAIDSLRLFYGGLLYQDIIFMIYM